MTTRELLEIEGLEVGYGAVPVLGGISLKVREDEPVAIIGANGAGKSTLLRAISGLLVPTRGRIWFRGEDIAGRQADEVVKLGVSHAPENRRIFAQMTVYENLKMGAFIVHGRQEFRTRLERVLSIFPEIRKHLAQLGGTLSGGEQQMLSIGRALMRDSRLLLMDEPTVGLSPRMVDLLAQKIKDMIRHGVNILLVEQNVRLALEVTQKCYMLNLGRVVLEQASSLMAKDSEILKKYLGVE